MTGEIHQNGRVIYSTVIDRNDRDPVVAVLKRARREVHFKGAAVVVLHIGERRIRSEVYAH